VRCAILNRRLVEEEILKQYPTQFPLPVGRVLPNMESPMSLKVVLAIGVDSSLLEIQGSAWKSSGYIITFAWSIKDAITHFRYGDFDLVLLGQSLSVENRERLTFLIRASGSRVPVVFIADPSSASDRFVDATVKGEPTNILQEIEDLLASRVGIPASRSNTPQSLSLPATAQ